ncbi:MAG: fumarylacetoacetate hydrolase family protein [Deltaproteobacteria bacterium]|nr:fumarylacetoacetate hydrolase family protein [Deltaproteobacteria bacterium]
MGFRLLSYRSDKEEPRAGLLVEDKIVMDIETALEARGVALAGFQRSSVLSVLENWQNALPALRDLAGNSKASSSAVVGPLSTIRLAAPILYPPNIYCAAANYVDHSKEMGDNPLPDKSQARPYFFTKLPRQTVIGHDEPIQIPYPEAKVDWEAEIGVVMGRHCRNVPAAQAMQYVAGFTVLNDLSDRARNFRKDWDFKFDWLGGKSFNTSAPLGPWITPVEFIGDPHDLSIRLWVNEELMQNASSRQMYFTIPEQIEYLSGLLSLLPGDVISTGTPMGVGHARGRYLSPGDTVTISVEGLGTIKNPVTSGF